MTELKEKRRSRRIRIRLPVLLVWGGEGQEHREHTYTVSVSWHGCGVHSHFDFQPGDRVRLERNDAAVEGQVAYSLKDHSIKLVEVGIGFDREAREFWGIADWSA